MAETDVRKLAVDAAAKRAAVMMVVQINDSFHLVQVCVKPENSLRGSGGVVEGNGGIRLGAPGGLFLAFGRSIFPCSLQG